MHHKIIDNYPMFPFQFGVAISPRQVSGPLLFSGRLEEGLNIIEEAGFNGVELSLRSISDIHAGEMKKRLAESGLTCSAIATGQYYTQDGYCLGSSQSGVRDKVLEHLKDMVMLADQLGAAIILGGIRGQVDDTRADYLHKDPDLVDRIREIAIFAKNQGVQLLIEPINHKETNFINSALDGLAAIQAIGLDSLKLLMDTYHMNIEEISIPEALKTVSHVLGYVHFSDSNREAPGRGKIDFCEVIKTLQEIDYSGYITIEINPIPDDRSAVLTSTETIQSALEKLNYPA